MPRSVHRALSGRGVEGRAAASVVLETSVNPDARIDGAVAGPEHTLAVGAIVAELAIEMSLNRVDHPVAVQLATLELPVDGLVNRAIADPVKRARPFDVATDAGAVPLQTIVGIGIVVPGAAARVLSGNPARRVLSNLSRGGRSQQRQHEPEWFHGVLHLRPARCRDRLCD